MHKLKIIISHIHCGMSKNMEWIINDSIQERVIFVENVLSQYSMTREEEISFLKGSLRPIVLFENEGLDEKIINIDFIRIL